MEQILIQVNSDDTSSAIKKFVSQFKDASVEEQVQYDDSYYMETYGISKLVFESRLNTGIAQSILGITKPWNEVKEELLAKISKP